MSLDVTLELGRFPAERCQESHTGSKLPRKRDWLPPHCATHRRLYFGGLNLGNRGFDRLENLFGKVGIKFARFRYIPNELLEKRLGEFGLNLKGALERLGAEQLFEEGGTVLERLFRILARFGGDRLLALGKRRRRSGHHLELLFAVFLEIIELVGQFYPLS
jgi:hypothetical protein